MRVYFYVKVNGITLASGSASTKEEAEIEANRYAFFYSEEGEVKITYRTVK